MRLVLVGILALASGAAGWTLARATEGSVTPQVCEQALLSADETMGKLADVLHVVNASFDARDAFAIGALNRATEKLEVLSRELTPILSRYRVARELCLGLR